MTTRFIWIVYFSYCVDNNNERIETNDNYDNDDGDRDRDDNNYNDNSHSNHENENGGKEVNNEDMLITNPDTTNTDKNDKRRKGNEKETPEIDIIFIGVYE